MTTRSFSSPMMARGAIVDVFHGGETGVHQFALTKHGDEIAALLKGSRAW